MKIYVGNSGISEAKAIAAAMKRAAIKRFEVVSVDTVVEQNRQPVGLDETLRIALARADFVKCKKGQHVYAMGIENGIIRSAELKVTLDLAVIALLTPKGKRLITTSTGIVFPEAFVNEAQDAGFENNTAGERIIKARGEASNDPHLMLTKGGLSRKDLLIGAVFTLLLQLG